MIARLGWRLAVPVVLAASGVLFVTSAQTAHGTDLRTGGRTKLSDLVVEQEQRNARLAAQLARARGSVDSLTASLSLDPATHQPGQRVERAGGAGRSSRTRGSGSPSMTHRPLAPGAQRPSWVTSDDLVVHQQDLQAVVNALWHGGAEAIQVMDQRIVSTSAVRCVGNTLILQGGSTRRRSWSRRSAISDSCAPRSTTSPGYSCSRSTSRRRACAGRTATSACDRAGVRRSC